MRNLNCVEFDEYAGLRIERNVTSIFYSMASCLTRIVELISSVGKFQLLTCEVITSSQYGVICNRLWRKFKSHRSEGCDISYCLMFY